MATTVKHQPPTNKYIQVISGTSNEFLLQNVGSTPVMIIWNTSVPQDDDKGHILQPGDAVTRGSLTGNVFARALNKDGIMVASEE